MKKLTESPYKAEVVLERLFEDNGKSVAKPIHWIDSDDFNNQNINWTDDVKVKQIRLGITQRGGYAHDLYIDYIKFMES